MVTTEFNEFDLLAHGLKLPQQGTALVEIVLSKADEQPLATMLLAANQTQGFFWSWAEFAAHTEARRQLSQQWNRAVGREVVEAQQGFPLATPPLIGR